MLRSSDRVEQASKLPILMSGRRSWQRTAMLPQTTSFLHRYLGLQRVFQAFLGQSYLPAGSLGTKIGPSPRLLARFIDLYLTAGRANDPDQLLLRFDLAASNTSALGHMLTTHRRLPLLRHLRRSPYHQCRFASPQPLAATLRAACWACVSSWRRPRQAPRHRLIFCDAVSS